MMPKSNVNNGYDVTLSQLNVIHDVVVIVPRNQHGGCLWFFSTPFLSPLNWHENHFDRVDCNARVFLTCSMGKTCKRSNLMKLWKHSRKTFVVHIYLREILPMLVFVNTKWICCGRKPRAQKVMTSDAIRIRDLYRCERSLLFRKSQENEERSIVYVIYMD
jgi:hypothetical protein